MNSLDVLTNFTAKTTLDEADISAPEHDLLSFSATPPSLEKNLQVEHRCSNQGVTDRANGQADPPKRVNCGGIRKTKAITEASLESGENGRSSGRCFSVLYKNRPTRVYLVALLGVFWPAGALLSFLPSSEPLHLRHLNMSFAGARHFVATNNIFNEAKTVSGLFSHEAS